MKDFIKRRNWPKIAIITLLVTILAFLFADYGTRVEIEKKLNTQNETITTPINTATTTEFKNYTKDEYISKLSNDNRYLSKQLDSVLEKNHGFETTFIKFKQANDSLSKSNRVAIDEIGNLRKALAESQMVSTNYILISSLQIKEMTAMSNNDWGLAKTYQDQIKPLVESSDRHYDLFTSYLKSADLSKVEYDQLVTQSQ